MAASRQRRTKPKSKSVARPSQVKVPPPQSEGERPPLPPKLSPPRPGRLYPRERLFNLLDSTRMDHRIIWVSAPAGAGKTSLATSYLSVRKLPVLWYQVDQGDGDVASFFYYMGLAANRAAPRKTALPPFTPEHLGNISAFARNFFRLLYSRLPTNCVIVLDNYQNAPEASLLHEVLHIALSEVPEGRSLLVLSRVEPPSVLARLLLCEHAACLDWEKIQLTHEETAGLARLRPGRAQLDSKSIEVLYTRTHGWAAGVVLMLEQSTSDNSIEFNQTPAGQRLLFDYFATEIFDKLDDNTQAVLVAASFLPKMTAAMTERLGGHPHAGQVLSNFSRKHYFTTIHAGAEPMFEFHPLFREFLRGRAQARYTPTQLMKLQRDAAMELEASGQTEAAAELLQATSDWGALQAHVLKHAPALAAQARFQTLETWLRALPESALENTPWLRYWLGVCRMQFNPREAQSSFEQAYAGFIKTDEAAGLYASWASVAGCLFISWRDFKPFALWLEALEDLRRRHPRWPSPEIELRVVIGAIVGYSGHRPDHPDLRSWLTHAQRLIVSTLDDVQRIQLAGPMALTFFWTGEYRQAIRLIESLDLVSKNIIRSMPVTAQWWDSVTLISYWHRLMTDTALQRCNQALAASQALGIHILDGIVCSQGAYAALIAGDLSTAEKYLQAVQVSLPPDSPLANSHYLQILTLADLHAGRFAAAVEHSRQALSLAQTAAMPFCTADSHIGLAMALLESGEPAQAQDNIDAARAIGLAMGSRAIECWCSAVEAHAAFKQANTQAGQRLLARFLGLSRDMGGAPLLYFSRPQLAWLYAHALEHDIETEHVRDLIRLLDLAPDGMLSLPETWPYPVKLHTLGRFSVVLADKPHARSPSHKKPLELLQALITLGGRDVDEDDLAETLWPGTEGDAARRNLKVNIHRLRKLLPEETIVWSEGKLSLNARRVWVDLWVLERELTRLDQISSTTPTSESISLLDRIFNLYHGEFLLGNTASWVLTVRERLRNKALRILARAAESISQRDSAAAVPIYERAIELDPLREALYQGLIRCYQKLEQPAEGMRIYQRCQETLKRELGVSPSPTTEALHQALKTST